jgi:hypothetical protein
MEGVDTERVQRITYEMSKGSAHFVNEQRKQAAVTERIDKMQARAAQLTPALVGTQPALCTPPSRPFARHPAGPCLSISLRLALERPPSSVSYNNGAQLRPLRLCSHWSGAALAAGGGTTAHSAIAYDSTGDDARPVAHVAVRLPLGLAPCLPPRLSLTASLTISPTGPRTVSPSPSLPHRLAHHLSHWASHRVSLPASPSPPRSPSLPLCLPGAWTWTPSSRRWRSATTLRWPAGPWAWVGWACSARYERRRFVGCRNRSIFESW